MAHAHWGDHGEQSRMWISNLPVIVKLHGSSWFITKLIKFFRNVFKRIYINLQKYAWFFRGITQMQYH